MMLFTFGVFFLCLYEASASDIVATPPEVYNATSAILSCNLTSTQWEVKSHYWTKNDKTIESTRKDSSALHMEYRLDKIDPSSGGVYACVFTFMDGHTEHKNIEVKTVPHVGASKHSEHGNEKDKGVLVCLSHGYPLPNTWVWLIKHDMQEKIITNDTEKYEIKSTPNKTTLIILDLDIQLDAATYVCRGINELGVEEDSIQLRVRSRLAALWPFLGIVAEVIVLIAVIFIYEKRRKPDEINDDDDSGAAPLKGDTTANHTDKNIRQRNSN
ncbi:basigin-like isoform X1 [Paramormyrops kingsleyae]|uniref:Basigin n=1 Tax=Paramormyrops kingsleyae TaxID=1676925 RepID=A0A3B3SFZ7_9TELE|nr:basigin-like isoform X1 [Paramormyrops kingsleyae]